MEANNVEKRVWVSPKLLVHGSIEHITREHPIINKNAGGTDAVVAAAHDVGIS